MNNLNNLFFHFKERFLQRKIQWMLKVPHEAINANNSLLFFNTIFLYYQKRPHTKKKKVYFKNCSPKGSLGNQKWFFNNPRLEPLFLNVYFVQINYRMCQ